MKILIVEDDIDIGDVLEKALKIEGFQVQRAYSGTEAFLLLKIEKYALVLLDLMLPGVCGEDLVKEVKDMPCVIISAKADLDNKVTLLENGALDYITKPFYLKEVIARVKNAIKHTTVEGMSYQYKEITIVPDKFQAFVGNNEIKLTKTEFQRLLLLIKHPKQVMSKKVIAEELAEVTLDGVETSLNTHISNLRSKIQKYAKENYIDDIW